MSKVTRLDFSLCPPRISPEIQKSTFGSEVRTPSNAPQTRHMPLVKKRTVCRNCRAQHLKCDDERPACRRCASTGKACLRGYPIRFIHDQNPSISGSQDASANNTSFERTQQWQRTTNALAFVDETKALEIIYATTEDCDNDAEQGVEATLSSRPDNLPRTKQRSIEDGFDFALQLTPSASMSFDQADCNVSPESHSARTRQLENARDKVEHPGNHLARTGHDSQRSTAERFSLSLDSSFTPTSRLLPSLYLEQPVWPLSSRDEAMLLRYYCTHLARNFDLLDPQRHFRNIIPQRAATCPVLLNAIFALSARHLSRVGQYDPLVSNTYYQACLQRLIPLLDGEASEVVLDENLLAAHVILRHLEEIEVPLTGFSPSNEQPSHLLGSHIFITAQERAVDRGGLREAAFWIGLRQDIYVAFVNQHSFIPTLDHCNIDQVCNPDAPNHIWSRNIVALCAEVVRYCFAGDEDGRSAQRTTTTYASLSQFIGSWCESKPASFTPIYYAQPSEDDIFPEIWYSQDDVVVGLQHYHLAMILLRAHDPTMPRLGARGAEALRESDNDIRDHVRALCGICVSNRDTAPNFAYASMAIAVAGDKFGNLRDQEALLAILEATENEHGWPTSRAKENLKVAWGFSMGVHDG